MAHRVTCDSPSWAPTPLAHQTWPIFTLVWPCYTWQSRYILWSRNTRWDWQQRTNPITKVVSFVLSTIVLNGLIMFWCTVLLPIGWLRCIVYVMLYCSDSKWQRKHTSVMIVAEGTISWYIDWVAYIVALLHWIHIYMSDYGYYGVLWISCL